MTQDLLGVAISALAVVIALVAASFAARTYLLKSGLRLRGSHTITSSIACEDPYVSSVTLENTKDRAVVIFAIYLQLDPGFFIELEDFSQEPLIIPPFGAIHRDYGPIEFYSGGMTRVRMGELIRGRKFKKRLVLSTTDGRYVVRRWIRRWDPVALFFKNHLAWVVQPIRSTFEHTRFGSNAKYVVVLSRADGREEIIPVFESDHQVQRFRSFTLTVEALDSAESLEEFLLERAVSGELACSDLEVRDLDEWRAEAYEHFGNEVVDASHRGWLTYHLFGRVYTWWSNLKLRRENRVTRKKHLAAAERSRLRGPSGPE